MGIRAWPHDVNLGVAQLCNICKQRMELGVLSVGAIGENERQTFACNVHFWNETQLITSYCTTLATPARTKRSDNQRTQEQGGGHEWSLH